MRTETSFTGLLKKPPYLRTPSRRLWHQSHGLELAGIPIHDNRAASDEVAAAHAHAGTP